jgi:hypothetical protein
LPAAGALGELRHPPLPLVEPDETQVTLKLEVGGVPESLSAEGVAFRDPFLLTMFT